MTNNHTDLKEAVWDYCVKSAREESWSRDELYAVIDSCFAKHTNSVEATIEELDRLANIYGWHHEKCFGHAHHPSCPVVKLRRMLTTLQAHTSQQVEEAVLQADATGAYHSGYLAGKAEVEEAVRKERERIKAVITQVREKYGLDIPDEVDSIDYDTGSDVADDIEEALNPNLNYSETTDENARRTTAAVNDLLAVMKKYEPKNTAEMARV